MTNVMSSFAERRCFMLNSITRSQKMSVEFIFTMVIFIFKILDMKGRAISLRFFFVSWRG